MEEERRLCYVAMTRAKERLLLTNAQQRMLYGDTRSNPPSRFLEEIPEEVLRQTGKPTRKRSAYGWNTYGGSVARDGGSAAKDAQSGGSVPKDAGTVTRKHKMTPEEMETALQRRRNGNAKAANVPDYGVGDLVEHTAFGKGVVLSVTPLSGDTLAEIRFDNAGTKKLMLKYVKDRMKKL